MAARSRRFDNLKFCLITLVVFGHLLELASGSTVSLIYRTIYLFHMPVFLFVSGYFADFSLRKLLPHLVLPYLIFQTLYQLFDALVLNGNTSLHLQYTKPFWLLWYLLAMIGYQLLLPLFKLARSLRTQIIVLLVCWGLSLAVGFARHIGEFLTLSRFLGFLPFFALGHYARAYSDRIIPWLHRARTWLLPLTAVIAFLGILWLWFTHCPADVLYGKRSYYEIGNPLQRLMQQVLAVNWGILLLLVIPDVSIPVVTAAGRNTMPVFLLHGFLIRALKKKGGADLLALLPHGRLIALAALALAVVLILSSAPVARVFQLLFTGGLWRNRRTAKQTS
jgi:fucose 4-O-acetylase-like acetyltransferase